MATVQHFAYNRTKFAFVSLEVEVAASAPAALDEWFPRLAPHSGSGVWMIPFHGSLPSTGAPSPIDLVYLDELGEVLNVVQSFPNAKAPVPPSEVASVLALPAQSIEQLRIETSDRLVICGGQDLEWRLKDDSPKKLVAGADPSDPSFADDPLPRTAANLTPAPAMEHLPVSPPPAPAMEHLPLPPPPAPAMEHPPVSPPPAPAMEHLPLPPPPAPAMEQQPAPPLPARTPDPQKGKAPRIRISHVDPAGIAAFTNAAPFVSLVPANAPPPVVVPRALDPLPVHPSRSASLQPPAETLRITARPDLVPPRAKGSRTHPPARTPRIVEIDPDLLACMDLPPPILPSGVAIPTQTAPKPKIQLDALPVPPVVKPPARPVELIVSKDFGLDDETPSVPYNGARSRIAVPVAFPSLDLPHAAHHPENPARNAESRQNPPSDPALLSALDQLEARIKAIQEAKAIAAGGRPGAPSSSEPLAAGAYRIIPQEEDNRPFGHYDVSPYMPRTDNNQPHAPRSAGATPFSMRKDGPPPTSQPKWWERALDLEHPPEDPRKSTRQPLEGLASFFWTGGIPKPHPIRDISLTGLYVVTRERWFPGTEIVMTLTKTNGESPVPGHSLSLCTRAVRWGHDGVGLQFLLATPMGRSSAHRHMAANVDLDELHSFLQRMKSAEGQNPPVDSAAKSGPHPSPSGIQLTSHEANP